MRVIRCVALLFFLSASASAEVQEVRFGKHEGFYRAVLELDAPRPWDLLSRDVDHVSLVVDTPTRSRQIILNHHGGPIASAVLEPRGQSTQVRFLLLRPHEQVTVKARTLDTRIVVDFYAR